MNCAKVFGIGFHKTGTTSLAQALSLLGYRVTGPNGVYDPFIARNVYDMAFALVDRYDAFQDNPWPILYKELDSRYPGSKFILTIRDTDRWIDSVVRDFGTGRTPMRQWIYGTGSPLGHEETYIRRYQEHNQEVADHFRDRPEDCLVLRITQGDGWDRLCPFLGKDPPGGPFPSLNRSAELTRLARAGLTVRRRVRSTLATLRAWLKWGPAA